MNLPHQVQQLESPAYVYDLNQPPVFFNNIPATNQVAQMIPQITAAVANNLSQSATFNTFRVFAFNFYSKNNWNNRDFYDLVCYVIGYVETEVSSNAIRDVNQIFQNTVPDAVSLYIVNLIGVFPQLRSVVDNQVLTALSQNAGFFQSKLNQIISFYHRSGINSPLLTNAMQQRQQTQIGGNFDPYRAGQQPQQQMMSGNNNFQSAAMGSGTVFSNGRNTLTMTPSNGAGTLRQDRHFTPRTPAPVQQTPQNFTTTVSNIGSEVTNTFVRAVDNKPEESMAETTAEAWRPSLKQPYKSLYNPEFQRKRYFRDGDDVIEVIEDREDVSMDRSRHSVMLLGGSYKLDTVTRKDIVAEQMDNLRTPTPVFDVEKELAGETVDVNSEVNEKVLCESYLEEAIFQGRKKQRLAEKKGNKTNIYRCFGLVAKPFITRNNYREIVLKMFNLLQFKDVAAYLKKMSVGLANLNSSSNNDDVLDLKDDVEKIRDRQDLIMFLDYVNKHMTKLINNWLRQKLSLTLNIDSFMDDVGDLPPFLLRYGEQYLTAYNKFQILMMEEALVQIEEADEDALVERLNDDGPALSYSFIVDTYSFTYVDLTAKELDISFEGNETLMVPELDYPLLYQIGLEATAENTKPFYPRYCLLITQDNELYELHRGPVGHPTILISRFK